MSETASQLVITQQSVALCSQLVRAPVMVNALTGPPPSTGDAAMAMKKNQTDPGMPFVRITDLSTDPKGDRVTVDAFNVPTGEPIMGDGNVSGNGVPLSSSSFTVIINMASFNVSGGAEMVRQRTRHDLRKIARAGLYNYFPNLQGQRSLVHVAGARGSQTGTSWTPVPVASSASFNSVMINTVQAPTYNRHFVVNGTNLTRGGLQTASLATTDVWKLAVLDNLALTMEAMDTKIPPVRAVGDEQAYDSPLKGILMMSPGAYNALITDISSTTSNLRAYQAAVSDRQRYAKDSPVFRGECGIWRGILVKKMDHTIKFNAGNSYQYITVANRLTETETAATVPALGGTHQVERCVLLGAQALARAEGASRSGVPVEVIENFYDAGTKVEYIGRLLAGERKFRFRFPNENGDAEPTDNGVLVIDAAVPII
jgi:hypothetical protein